MDTGIFALLQKLGLSSEETREVYNSGTRDRPEIEVYRDSKSGVIFIDGHYVGEQEYADGGYRDAAYYTSRGDYERLRDCERREAAYRQFYVGKDIADFGCGAGDFLRAVNADCASVAGFELQQDYVEHLNAAGIACHTSLDAVEDESLDVFFSFHAIEHLPDPVGVLEAMRRKLRKGGRVVLEVPHARDFLLTQLDCDAFRQFTLWSQHLVLHTRESMHALLGHCGFTNIVIEGVQRYPLSNHLNWLTNARPGGHRSDLSLLDDADLKRAYSNALGRIDATDTIVAIASA